MKYKFLLFMVSIGSLANSFLITVPDNSTEGTISAVHSVIRGISIGAAFGVMLALLLDNNQ